MVKVGDKFVMRSKGNPYRVDGFSGPHSFIRNIRTGRTDVILTSKVNKLMKRFGLDIGEIKIKPRYRRRRRK